MAPRKKAEGKPIPEVTQEVKELPDITQPIKEMPPLVSPENTIFINGKLVEIKPTKLFYYRNRTAMLYRAFDMFPVSDVIDAPVGRFDDERDGDKCFLDWLAAVFDDGEFAKEIYNDLDNETTYKILAIFKRVNRITEKEERQKNALKNLGQEAK